MQTPSETIAALELRSVPSGLFALDAIVKQAHVQIRFAGDVDPSRFLIVFDGTLGDVEAGLDRGIEAGGDDVLETLLLARAHHTLRLALSGAFTAPAAPASSESTLGILQSHTTISTIAATDRSLKAADVSLLRLRFATHLAGQGHAVLCGEQFDVEEALAAACTTEQTGVTIETRIIPRAASETFFAAAQRGPGPRSLSPLDA